MVAGALATSSFIYIYSFIFGCSRHELKTSCFPDSWIKNHFLNRLDLSSPLFHRAVSNEAGILCSYHMAKNRKDNERTSHWLIRCTVAVWLSLPRSIPNILRRQAHVCKLSVKFDDATLDSPQGNLQQSKSSRSFTLISTLCKSAS